MSIEAINKWLSAGASIAVMAGVVAAAVGVFVATRTLKEMQEAASATLMLNLRDTLASDRYGKITGEIQNNDSAHPLLKDHGGKFSDMDVEEYIGNFEDLGYLVHENVLIPEMAYDHFSYDIEKAWCNGDVQRVVREARKADKSITAASDPIYGYFGNLAQNYLTKERQSCNDLNNQ